MSADEGYAVVAGVDEAGRGPIAGPVMTAAVMLVPPQVKVLRAEGLDDSKKLTARMREKIFARMKELGVVWRAQGASHKRIDATNILAATLWAMRRAVAALPECPDVVVVDGLIPIPDLPCRQMTLARADSRVPAVMAASVVAKVLRDRIMVDFHKLYPEYEFEKHKGYPTARHRALVDMLGPSPIHRLSFGGYSKTPKAGNR